MIQATMDEVTTMNSSTLDDKWCEDEEMVLASKVGILALAVVLSAFSILGNTLVLVVLFRVDRTKRPINCIIYNLALSDLLCSVAFIVYLLGSSSDGPVKEFLGEDFISVNEKNLS